MPARVLPFGSALERKLPMKTVVALIALCASTALSPPSSAVASEVRVYVTNSAGDSIEAIDTATNKVVQVIGGIAVPHGVGFSPDGRRIYVSSEAENVLDVIDPRSGSIINKLRLSG